jgi:hypothetical protein
MADGSMVVMRTPMLDLDPLRGDIGQQGHRVREPEPGALAVADSPVGGRAAHEGIV